MSVDKVKHAIETGIEAMEISQGLLDKGNAGTEEAGKFIAHIWARLEGLQIAILRFSVEHQTSQIAPHISKAREVIEPVITDTLSVLTEPRDEQVQRTIHCTQKLKEGLLDHADVVGSLMSALDNLHDGISPLLDQAKLAAEGCKAARETGTKFSEYQSRIIAELKEYNL